MISVTSRETSASGMYLRRISAASRRQGHLPVGGKVIFPHHHETILDLEGGPDLISDMLDLVHREAPGTEVICPRKSVWYRIGMQIHEEA